jgi:hypothetical protein
MQAWKGSIYWLFNLWSIDENMLHNFEIWYMISLRPTSETSLQVYISTALVSYLILCSCDAQPCGPQRDTNKSGQKLRRKTWWLVHVWNTCWEYGSHIDFRSECGTVVPPVCRVWRSFVLIVFTRHPRIALLFPTSLHSTFRTLLYKLTIVVHIIPRVPFLSSILLYGHCPYWLTLVVLAVHRESQNVFHPNFPPTYITLHYLSISPSLYSLLFL